MAARGLGMVAYGRGDLPAAWRWLTEADRRARQDEDRYVWIHAFVQDARCRVSVSARLPHAETDIQRLTLIAAKAQLPEFAVRADLHLAALGVPEARERARAMASTLDNPALAAATARRR